MTALILIIVGVVLNFLLIDILKNTRTKSVIGCYRNTLIPEKPILNVMGLTLILISSIIPVVNLMVFLICIIAWVAEVWGSEDWVCKEGSRIEKIIQYFSKPIE